MTVTIELPATKMPRTHIAAKVACDYVSHKLSKLTASDWVEMQRTGSIVGTVCAEYVGIVKYTVIADM